MNSCTDNATKVCGGGECSITGDDNVPYVSSGTPVPVRESVAIREEIGSEPPVSGGTGTLC
jgi:hypothetical protein